MPCHKKTPNSALSSANFRVRRCSALTRQASVRYFMSVNCRPARRCVPPVIVPAQAFVRAGGWRRGNAATFLIQQRLAFRAIAPQRSGTRKDPSGSNLWPDGSGCIKMFPIRTNDQTRAAPKRRGVGLHTRSGVSAGTARRVACAKRSGYRHCRHGKTRPAPIYGRTGRAV